jgi:hypothetical protein
MAAPTAVVVRPLPPACRAIHGLGRWLCLHQAFQPCFIAATSFFSIAAFSVDTAPSTPTSPRAQPEFVDELFRRVDLLVGLVPDLDLFLAVLVSSACDSASRII